MRRLNLPLWAALFLAAFGAMRGDDAGHLYVATTLVILAMKEAPDAGA